MKITKTRKRKIDKTEVIIVMSAFIVILIFLSTLSFLSHQNQEDELLKIFTNY